MKIALFSIANISYGGGFEQQILRLAEAFAKRGHHVSILNLSKNATYKLAVLLSIFYLHPRFAFPELQKKIISRESKIEFIEFSSINDLRKILRSFDVVYAKNEIFDSVILRLARSKKMPPLICGVHTLLRYTSARTIHARLHNMLYTSNFYFWLVSFYKTYHCINKEQKTILEKKIDKNKICYIPNFIPIPVKRITFPQKQFMLLFVGRLTVEKGIDRFISLVERLSKEDFFNDIQFVICGAGPYDNEIKELCRRFNNVTYKGFVSAKEMEEIYLSTTFLCVPSRGESFPVACLEAQSYGIPIIGFNIDGLRDIIMENKNGYLVNSENIELFAQSIKKLYIKIKTERRLIKDLSKFSRDFVREKYSLEVLLPLYEKMFVYAKKNEN